MHSVKMIIGETRGNMNLTAHQKANKNNGQEMEQSERKSHSKNTEVGKNKLTIRYQ